MLRREEGDGRLPCLIVGFEERPCLGVSFGTPARQLLRWSEIIPSGQGLRNSALDATDLHRKSCFARNQSFWKHVSQEPRLKQPLGTRIARRHFIVQPPSQQAMPCAFKPSSLCRELGFAPAGSHRECSCPSVSDLGLRAYDLPEGSRQSSARPLDRRGQAPKGGACGHTEYAATTPYEMMVRIRGGGREGVKRWGRGERGQGCRTTCQGKPENQGCATTSSIPFDPSRLSGIWQA